MTDAQAPANSFDSLDSAHALRAQCGGDAPDLLLAVSGGLDSMVLLRVVASHRALFGSVRVAHVNHGLNERAPQWARHVEDQARALGLDVLVGVVDVVADGRGPEGAARDARYRWLASVITSTECLVTAHHADDQAETFLLRAMRGAGVRGLGAMRVKTELWGMPVVRPLLRVARSELEYWAAQHGIAYVNDPSNDSARFDRNFLRAEVMPRLRERWPDAVQSIGDSAHQLAEDSALLDQLADLDLLAARERRAPSLFPDTRSIDLKVLESLDRVRLRNAMRRWLLGLTGETVGRARVQAVLEQLCRVGVARGEHRMGELVFRRHGDFAYVSVASRNTTRASAVDLQWTLDKPLEVPALGVRLIAQPVRRGGLDPVRVGAVRIVSRAGDDLLKVDARRPRQSVRKLYQKAGVPPWERHQVPLVRSVTDGAVIAIPGLCSDVRWAPSNDAPGVRIAVQYLCEETLSG